MPRYGAYEGEKSLKRLYAVLEPLDSLNCLWWVDH